MISFHYTNKHFIMQRQYAREKQETKNPIFNDLYALFGHKDSVFLEKFQNITEKVLPYAWKNVSLQRNYNYSH